MLGQKLEIEAEWPNLHESYRQALNVPTPPIATEVKELEAGDEPVRANFVCAHCGAQMFILETFVRGQTIRGPPLARGDP